MEIVLTNPAPGIRGIHTANGLVYFKPGESKLVEFAESDEGHTQAERAHEVGIVPDKAEHHEEPAPSASVPDNATDRDDLKKQAEELGLEYPKNIPTEKLKEMIDAKLAE